MAIKTTRKCASCSEEIILEKDNPVLLKKKYYHYDCFIVKETTKKRNTLTLDQAESLAKEIIEENKEYINELISKNHLYLWLQKKYELISIPSYIYQKLADINSGNWKDLNRGISSEDLLDMFQRQWTNLQKTYSYNIKKGKKLSPENRLNYDISIIVNKSASYYEWKNKAKDQQVEMLETLKSSTPILNFKRKINTEEIVNENDLSQYLEEV